MGKYSLAIFLCSCFIFSCHSFEVKQVENDEEQTAFDNHLKTILKNTFSGLLNKKKVNQTEIDSVGLKRMHLEYNHHKKCFIITCDANGRMYNTEITFPHSIRN
jgi:hypothetical protein